MSWYLSKPGNLVINMKEYPEKSSTVLKQVAKASEKDVVEPRNKESPRSLNKINPDPALEELCCDTTYVYILS